MIRVGPYFLCTIVDQRQQSLFSSARVNAKWSDFPVQQGQFGTDGAKTFANTSPYAYSALIIPGRNTASPHLPTSKATDRGETIVAAITTLSGAVSINTTALADTVTDTIAVGAIATCVAITPNRTRPYITNSGGDSISVIGVDDGCLNPLCSGSSGSSLGSGFELAFELEEAQPWRRIQA